jgi:murein L,D-transpeptidase YcbB/YkuD
MVFEKTFSSYRCLLVAVLILLAFRGIAIAAELSGPRLSDSLRERLQGQIAAAGGSAKIAVAGEFFQAPAMLVRFYEQRAFQPVWMNDAGPLPIVHALMQTIREADRHGLKPAMYHLSALEAWLTDVGRDPVSDTASAAANAVALELLLSDAFFHYGSHVLNGRINPEAMSEAWLAKHAESDVDLVQLLQEAVATNSVKETLDHLRPSHPAYDGLLRARARYHEIATHGGWSPVPEGSKLQQDDRGPRVAALRERLLITGDLSPEAAQGEDLFDTAVEQAVRRFQQHHGLEVDGIVGPSTLAALNVPVEARLRQIELNMERWRWLPGQLGERAILVNIPAFGLEVVERGQPVLTMRVVVGRPTRRTPLLSADISYLVFNPHWYVPPNIAIQDKLPILRKDPGYAARQRLKIFRGDGMEATPIDPSAIDWSAVTARNFPYRLRQDPGPSNALGRVKFMFPNPFHVYLHDTPSRELFAKAERAFSSGCIRVEKPLELAEHVLSETPAWSRDKMLVVLDTKKEHTVRLSTPIPVHLLYATAWMNAQGAVEFRKDIYDHDKALEKLLQDALPTLKNGSEINIARKY